MDDAHAGLSDQNAGEPMLQQPGQTMPGAEATLPILAPHNGAHPSGSGTLTAEQAAQQQAALNAGLQEQERLEARAAQTLTDAQMAQTLQTQALQAQLALAQQQAADAQQALHAAQQAAADANIPTQQAQHYYRKLSC